MIVRINGDVVFDSSKKNKPVININQPTVADDVVVEPVVADDVVVEPVVADDVVDNKKNILQKGFDFFNN